MNSRLPPPRVRVQKALNRVKDPRITLDFQMFKHAKQSFGRLGEQCHRQRVQREFLVRKEVSQDI